MDEFVRTTAVCESCLQHERSGGRLTAARMQMRLADGSEVKYFYVPQASGFQNALIEKYGLPALDRLQDVVGVSFEVVVQPHMKYPSVSLLKRLS